MACAMLAQHTPSTHPLQRYRLCQPRGKHGLVGGALLIEIDNRRQEEALAALGAPTKGESYTGNGTAARRTVQMQHRRQVSNLHLETTLAQVILSKHMLNVGVQQNMSELCNLMDARLTALLPTGRRRS